MRQAGRYMESYRRIRARHDVLTICKTPELAAKVTLDAAGELGVDAAILFADIMLPLEGMGVSLSIGDGGPQIEDPLRNEDGASRLKKFVPEQHVPYVLDTVERVKSGLDDKIPLIGFSGAPFTLASYLIEGGPSRDFTETKKMMYKQPDVWNKVMSSLTTTVSSYLQAQVEAGVDAVQVFDTWSGCLSPADYEEFVLPFTKKVFEELEEKGVPRIHFGVGTAGLLESMKKAGGDVYGVDWRVPIDYAWRVLGQVAIQGNLDPAAVLGKWELTEARVIDILNRIGGRPGHIFNLGHGVLPETEPEHLKRLVKFVQEKARGRR
jgi:uroporphyrinogen decarboxylase